MQYSYIQGTIYSSLKYNPFNRTFSDLKQEEESDKNLLKTLTEKSDNKINSLNDLNPFKVTDSTKTDSNYQKVLFDDPISGMRISLNLSKENINKLQNHFDTRDFYKRADDTLRLSGKAEAFVSGWFGDIAYTRNYMRADDDKNGKLDPKEQVNVVDGYRVGAIIMPSKDGNHKYVEVEFRAYETLSARGMTDTSNVPSSIQEALNRTLHMDKNLDGEVKAMPGEGFRSERENAHYINEIVEYVIKKLRDPYANAKDITDTLEEDVKRFKQLQKALQALEKLKNSKGDLQSLEPEERKALENAMVLGDKQFKLSDKDLESLETHINNQALDAISDYVSHETGLDKTELKESLEQAFFKNAPSSQLDFDSKELISVVDEIGTQIKNNEVSVLDVRV